LSALVIGIDVQAARDCPYVVVDATLRVVESGWVSSDSIARSVQSLTSGNKRAVFAIDAPRVGLSVPRMWFWRKGKWRARSHKEVGNGRHCEVVIAAHRLANPQWTPMADLAPE
jgi:hypothetical protein